MTRWLFPLWPLVQRLLGTPESALRPRLSDGRGGARVAIAAAEAAYCEDCGHIVRVGSACSSCGSRSVWPLLEQLDPERAAALREVRQRGRWSWIGKQRRARMAEWRR